VEDFFERKKDRRKKSAHGQMPVLATFGMLRMLGRMSNICKLMEPTKRGCEQWTLQNQLLHGQLNYSFGKLDYVGLIVDPDPFFLTNNMLVCSIKGNMYYDGSFWLGWALILLAQRTWPNRRLCFYLFRNMALIKHSSAPTRHSLPCRKLTNVKATC